MSEKNNGGPAFPGPDQQEQRENIHEGMSLRDYFAAKALGGLTASLSSPDACEWFVVNAVREDIEPKDRVARAAYEYADAMLRARAA